MKIHVLAGAEQDMAEAVDYYNQQTSGLGREFSAEVRRTFDRIAVLPEAWPRFEPLPQNWTVD